MPPPCSAGQNDIAAPTGRGGLPTSCLRYWNRLSCGPMASSITTASGLGSWAGGSASAGAIAEARVSAGVMDSLQARKSRPKAAYRADRGRSDNQAGCAEQVIHLLVGQANNCHHLSYQRAHPVEARRLPGQNSQRVICGGNSLLD